MKTGHFIFMVNFIYANWFKQMKDFIMKRTVVIEVETESQVHSEKKMS